MKTTYSKEVESIIIDIVSRALDFSIRGLARANIPLETPPDEKMGDLAVPCFALAKELKKAPHEIAKELADTITKTMGSGTDSFRKTEPAPIERVEAAGSYVNFFLNPKTVAEKILTQDSRLRGNEKKGTRGGMRKKSNTLEKSNEKTKRNETKKSKEKIVIEYVSPNTNKPLHLGHARNGALGDALARMNEYLETDVVRTLLVNDRGIHICKSMTGYEWARDHGIPTSAGMTATTTPKDAGVKGDHFVGDYYVLYETLRQKHPEIEKHAKECLQKWEEGEKKTRALWKKMNAWTIAGMKATMRRLGFTFDKTYFESDIYASGREIILKGLKIGIFKKDETGAVYADLEQFGLPHKVLLRRDGTALYITQDIYLAYQKWKDFSPRASIYVVASEQDLYFKQFFAVLNLLGVPYADHLFHLSYGMVRLPEGKMKSREGTVVDVDNLLDELVALVKKETTKRSLDPGDEKEVWEHDVHKRSEAIALAALKYYLLIVSPHSDMIFNPKESIALQGKTGPYLLYTYARLRSIARKARQSSISLRSTCNDTSYNFVPEKTLVLALMRFEDTITRAADDANPSLLAHYLYDLAQKTNDYYHATAVLKSPEPTRTARVLVIAKIADTLKTGLSLLGIKTIEKM